MTASHASCQDGAHRAPGELLARGDDPLEAVRFACATAGISVTRPGTAPSMPDLAEVEALMKKSA